MKSNDIPSNKSCAVVNMELWICFCEVYKQLENKYPSNPEYWTEDIVTQYLDNLHLKENEISWNKHQYDGYPYIHISNRRIK